MSFHVTAAPSALGVPLTLADPGVTLPLGSAKVQVGITSQSASGAGAPTSTPSGSSCGPPSDPAGTRSFSRWPKSILKRPGDSTGSTDRMTMPLMPPELSSISANQRYSPALRVTNFVWGWPL